MVYWFVGLWIEGFNWYKGLLVYWFSGLLLAGAKIGNKFTGKREETGKTLLNFGIIENQEVDFKANTQF